MIPADCILVDDAAVVECNESSLTGEAVEVHKTRRGDCFLLSSSLLTAMPHAEQGGRCRALVIAVGKQSQWGKIKTSLATEIVNTPLQDKLQEMTRYV
jgi:Ca2+-transporting ATPase/Ca2+ transporting ATPase